MRPSIVSLPALLALLGGLHTASAADPRRMEITLQRLEAGAWKLVDPGLIFDRNDRVRFRYRANFDGYLYVLNMSTSGKYEKLFPREETGRDNRVKAGIEYTIPATEAEFRIGGPAGHETTYWLVSPVELKVGTAPGQPSARPSGDLTPRCDDEIFRARGDCVDSSAGPQGVSKNEDLPANLAASGAQTPRELTIMRRQNTTVVAAPPETGPVIYEFRLAHK